MVLSLGFEQLMLILQIEDWLQSAVLPEVEVGVLELSTLDMRKRIGFKSVNSDAKLLTETCHH